MAKRFKNLEYALKMLRTSSTATSTPQAPEGSHLRQYQEFASKQRAVSYTRDSSSNPESIIKVAVLPFYFGGDDTKGTLVAQSKRADDASTMSGVQTACNQITANPQTHVKLHGFKPARATVFDYGTTVTSETSKITGVKYKKRSGKSYTFPFGASASEKKESEVRKGITAAVVTLGTASVSFSPESY